jgi:hypothetical protein
VISPDFPLTTFIARVTIAMADAIEPVPRLTVQNA